jgi:hypothetical protein
MALVPHSGSCNTRIQVLRQLLQLLHLINALLSCCVLLHALLHDRALFCEALQLPLLTLFPFAVTIPGAGC